MERFPSPNGCLSINLDVQVVELLLDGEDFLVCEEDVFVPVLSMPLEDVLLLSFGSPSKQEQGCVPLSGSALSC